jgi:hypothetical protein
MPYQVNGFHFKRGRCESQIVQTRVTRVNDVNSIHGLGCFEHVLDMMQGQIVAAPGIDQRLGTHAPVRGCVRSLLWAGDSTRAGREDSPQRCTC